MVYKRIEGSEAVKEHRQREVGAIRHAGRRCVVREKNRHVFQAVGLVHSERLFGDDGSEHV